MISVIAREADRTGYTARDDSYPGQQTICPLAVEAEVMRQFMQYQIECAVDGAGHYVGPAQNVQPGC